MSKVTKKLTPEEKAKIEGQQRRLAELKKLTAELQTLEQNSLARSKKEHDDYIAAKQLTPDGVLGDKGAQKKIQAVESKAASIIQAAFRYKKKFTADTEVPINMAQARYFGNFLRKKQIKDKIATIIQAAYRGHVVRQSEDGGEHARRKKAAIFFQKNARRRLVQNQLQKLRQEQQRKEEEQRQQKQEWLDKWKSETSPEKGEAGAKVLRGVVQMQANIRRALVQKRAEKMRADKAEQEALLKAQEAAIQKELLARYPNGEAAARTIQAWWRGERDRIAKQIPPKQAKPKVNVKDLFPENDPAIQQIIKDHNLLENRKKTRYIDRSQLKEELTPAGQGNPPTSLVYDRITKTFIPAAPGQNRYQGQWIDGIFGDYNGGISGNYFGIREVEVEETAPDGTKTKKKVRVDANGKELDPSQPLFRVGRDGKIVQDDQFMLGSLGRSRANVNDMIELGPEGIPIAEFESSIALQASVNEVRNRIRMANLSRNGANPVIGFDETRCAFARYKHHNYNERKEYIGTEDRYVMLIETRQGLTEVFVKDNNILNRIAEVEKVFMDDGTYRTMISAALKAHEAITDVTERIAKAEQTVRQEIRHRAMQKIAQEVQEAQNQSRATQQFNDRDFAEIALAQGKIGDGAEKLKNKITRMMRNVPTPISNYVEHGGVAIQKSRRGAHITFNGAEPNDVFWMNYPGTSYYARVACAPTSGLYEVFEDGQSKFVFRNKGETWMDKNTIHYHDGANYVPLMVHTKAFGVNPQNTLANHQVAKYQGGYKGYKGIQQVYDNFAIQVSSQIDEVRSVAIKIKGEPVISTVLKPVAFKDKDDNQLKFAKKIASPNDITADPSLAGLARLQKNLKSQDVFAKHPAFTSLKGLEEVEEKTGISAFNPFAKAKSEANDPKIEAALKRIYDKVGAVYSRISMAGESSDYGYPEYSDSSKWRHIASDQGEFYRDRKLYKFDPATQEYVELTKQEIAAILMAPSSLNNKGEAIDGAPLSQEEANKYSGRFIAEISEMEVRDFTIASEAKNLEAKLRYNAMQGDKSAVDAILLQYLKLRDAIENASNGNVVGQKYTSEEKAAIYRDMAFDINACDPKSGKNALHLAAEMGRSDVVLSLLQAGADPLIKTTIGKKSKTASELAREAGKANANDPDNFVLKLEAKESEKRLNLSKEEIAKLKEDASILRARANDIKHDLEGLAKSVEEWVQYEIGVHALRSQIVGNDHNLYRAIQEEKESEIEAKKAKAVFDAKAKEYQEINKAAEDAEKKAGIKPAKAKEEGLVSTPDKYKTVYHRIDLPNSGKYIEIPVHLAYDDNCVVQYHNEKGELANKVLQKGEMIMDQNAVRYYYGKDAGFVTTQIKYSLAGLVLKDEPAKVPEGWNYDEWKEAFNAYRDFEKNGKQLDNNIFPDEFKGYQAQKALQDAAAKAAQATKTSTKSAAVDPAQLLKNMPAVATMPTLTDLASIVRNKPSPVVQTPAAEQLVVHQQRLR